jgi:hypothetical protein
MLTQTWVIFLCLHHSQLYIYKIYKILRAIPLTIFLSSWDPRAHPLDKYMGVNNLETVKLEVRQPLVHTIHYYLCAFSPPVWHSGNVLLVQIASMVHYLKRSSWPFFHPKTFHPRCWWKIVQYIPWQSKMVNFNELVWTLKPMLR